MYFTLRLPGKFITLQLGIPLFFYIISGVSCVLTYVIVMLLHDKEYFKLTQLFCWFIFSCIVSLLLVYIYVYFDLFISSSVLLDLFFQFIPDCMVYAVYGVEGNIAVLLGDSALKSSGLDSNSENSKGVTVVGGASSDNNLETKDKEKGPLTREEGSSNTLTEFIDSYRERDEKDLAVNEEHLPSTTYSPDKSGLGFNNASTKDAGIPRDTSNNSLVSNASSTPSINTLSKNLDEAVKSGNVKIEQKGHITIKKDF